MRTGLSLLGLSLLLLPAVVRAQAASAPADRSRAADEKAIRGIEAQWETAWNHHDVAAMVRLGTSDADWVNLAGEWFKGREAFAKSLEELHSGKVKESVWQSEGIQIKFLAPGIAVVHVYFNSHGDRNPDGTLMPPRRGIFTRVEEKRHGQWLVVASQATRIVPPETAVAWPLGAETGGHD